MNAIAQDKYGSYDALRLREIARPEVGPGEVLVQVRAAGVDAGVWILMTGRPYLIRVMGFGMRRAKALVRGRDLAGVVTAVGAAVTRFKPGDEVYGTCEGGSFAEYAVAAEDKIALKPSGLTFEQAAVVPVSGMTALQAVRDSGEVRAGQRVLVIGAAGGVGSFAVQIAKALGAQVTGVCRTEHTDLVRSLGADDVIDYTREEVDRDGACHDVIIDTGGDRPLSLLRRALARRGTLAIVGGGFDKGRLTGGFERQLRTPLVSLFTGQRLRMMTSHERADDLAELARLIDAGQVAPAVDRSFPLADAAEAIRYFAEGHPAGKVVVTL
ncbi:NAD(P)-dependent alcohol dehydrogenase [Streptosporangiaceae bacterium NEAU-GS5]|nr:NAD(P)-dependent alcohol dehydrogenase [Streptosporangiaceae bacterium NEAU-GS5]